MVCDFDFLGGFFGPAKLSPELPTYALLPRLVNENLDKPSMTSDHPPDYQEEGYPNVKKNTDRPVVCFKYGRKLVVWFLYAFKFLFHVVLYFVIRQN